MGILTFVPKNSCIGPPAKTLGDKASMSSMSMSLAAPTSAWLGWAGVVVLEDTDSAAPAAVEVSEVA